MNEDTINLLKECNAGCKSATSSMEQVMEHVKDQKLKALITKYNDKHIKIGDECHDMLNEVDENEKDPNKFAMAMAEMGTEMKLTINDSTKKIAGLLVDGCNMGIKGLSGYLNQYCTADAKSTKLTQRLIKLEKDFMDELLAFV